MKSCILIAILPALLLSGCAMDELKIGQYQARGVVTVPPVETRTVSATAQAIEAATPWRAVIDLLASVLPYSGQTRRKAMEERVNYTEERSMSLFSLKMKGSPAAMAPTSGEGESKVGWVPPVNESVAQGSVVCPNCGTVMAQLDKAPSGNFNPPYEGQVLRCPTEGCSCWWAWKAEPTYGRAHWVEVGPNEPDTSIVCPQCHLEMEKGPLSELVWKTYHCTKCNNRYKWGLNQATKMSIVNWKRLNPWE